MSSCSPSGVSKKAIEVLGDDSHTSLFAEILTKVDMVVTSYVETAFRALVGQHMTSLRILGAMYVAVYGWMVLRGVIKVQTMQVIWHLIFFVLAFMVLTSWDIFSNYIYYFFTSVPSALIDPLVSVLDNVRDKADVNSGLSVLYDKGMRLSELLWKDSMQGKVFSVIIKLVVFVFTSVGLGLLVISKLAMGVIMATAPIFIALILFENTRGVFEGWLRQAITFAVLPIFVYAFSGLGIIIAKFTFGGLKSDLQCQDLEWNGLMPFMLLIGAMSYIFVQLWGLAAQVGGGFSMQAVKAYEGSRTAARNSERIANFLGRNYSRAKNIKKSFRDNKNKDQADKK